jgi:hypothetical protein
MAPVATEVKVNTVQSIAQQNGVEDFHVEHILRSRSIKPLGYIGGTRYFTDSDALFIASELKRIRGDRRSGR